MEPSDIHKTAVTTPSGLFNFTRTPFGLRNSGQTFQRFIDHITRGLDFVFVYLDDLLVTSPEHKTHKKTFKTELSFLGHHVCLKLCIDWAEASRHALLSTSHRPAVL